MRAPSTALLNTFSPLRPHILPWTARGCLVRQQQQNFSTTPSRQKRNKGGGQKRDPRIKIIRYHLQHALTPRPLRFSRTRYLRHWTIHRAWQVYQSKLRKSREETLERQYNSMRDACEALRLIDDRGLTAEDRIKLDMPPDEGKETGRLFRIAMLKNGIWDAVPIEYAKIQTDSPSREGWNHAWTK